MSAFTFFDGLEDDISDVDVSKLSHDQRSTEYVFVSIREHFSAFGLGKRENVIAMTTQATACLHAPATGKVGGGAANRFEIQ